MSPLSPRHVVAARWQDNEVIGGFQSPTAIRLHQLRKKRKDKKRLRSSASI